MALKDEFSTTLDPIQCMDCNEALYLEVLQSAAGYYIGRFCPNCGPYERVSHYFQNRNSAETELKEFWIEEDVRPSGRDTNYHGG